jgi:hypothetical protein
MGGVFPLVACLRARCVSVFCDVGGDELLVSEGHDAECHGLRVEKKCGLKGTIKCGRVWLYCGTRAFPLYMAPCLEDQMNDNHP